MEQFDSQTSNVRKIRTTDQKMGKSGFFWNGNECRFSLTVKQRFESTSSRPIMTEDVQKLNEMIECQRGEIYRAHQETNDTDKINNFFTKSY